MSDCKKISHLQFLKYSLDCPYCEIEKLKAQLADLQTIHSATRSANISMTEQLEEATTQKDNYYKSYQLYMERAIDAERQLAEARAEVAALNDAKVTHYICGAADARQQARQEAARTIEQHLLGMFWTIPYKENEPMIYRDQAIEWVRETFGLEG